MEVVMEDSILKSMRIASGLESTDTSFDEELVIAINNAFFTLYQNGVGVNDAPFAVTGTTETWTSFLMGDDKRLPAKNFVQMSIRLTFDPPASSVVADCLKQSKDETLFRLNFEFGSH